MNPSANIRNWLEGIGLGELVGVFEDNHITPDVLHTLDADDLREMGISSLGHRKRLLAAIAGLNAPAALPARPAPEPPPAPMAVRESTPAPFAPQRIPLKAADPVVRKVAAPVPAPAIPHPAIDPQPAVELPSFTVGTKSKRKAFSAKFLTISVCVHLIFGVGGGYWVVQRIEAKRKLQFAAGPPTANPNKRALEHKVSLQKKKNAGGSPAQAKRISVTGLSAKITLPDMPAVPTTSTQFVAGRMAGMGGAGFGSGLGFGNGSGMGVGGAGAGGLGLTMFGARGGGLGLVGTFYDLKQTKDRKPTDMAGEGTEMRFQAVVSEFMRSWNPRTLSKYFAAPGKLTATQLFIPKMSANEAPKAFQVEKECQGSRWLAHYQGEIVAPRDGKFRFVGSGDDILIVRCKGSNVLDGSVPIYKVAPEVNESNNVGRAAGHPMATGKWISMKKNEVMRMEVLIGEIPGGYFSSFLMIEEQGVTHPSGTFPVFQLRQGDVPSGDAPSHHGTIVFGSRTTGSGLPLNLIR